MRKKIIISSIFLLGLLVLLMVWLSSSNEEILEPATPTEQEYTFPNNPDGEIGTEEPTRTEWEFLSDPTIVDATVDGWEGYVIGSEVTAEGNVFEIYYSVPDDSFFVTLEAFPLAFARQRAEQVLSEKLNLPPTELCQLNITVSVPIDVDEALAGQNLGLSMCPGSVAL